MEMSLDEIIKQTKSSRPRRGGARGSMRGSSRGSSRGGRGSSRGRGRGSFRGGPSRGGRPAGVMRGRGRGGISRRNSSPRFKSRGGSFSPKKFSGATSETTKLIVSNLDFGVTDSDILELFSEFGPMRSAGVHYDRSGRSLGSADLIFERRADAVKAMKQYNGVPLDGREMKIQLATSELPVSPRRAPTGGFKRGGSRGSFGRGRGRGRGRGASGGRGAGGKPGTREPKKQPTAAELDAELEEYAKNKVTNSDGA